MEIDWTKPIEAVHTDGRTISMKVVQCAREPYQTHDYPDGETNEYWYSDGRDYCDSPYSGAWTIRNVQPTTPPIPAELVERMVAYCRMIATSGIAIPASHLQGEARAIVAELPVVREVGFYWVLDKDLHGNWRGWRPEEWNGKTWPDDDTPDEVGKYIPYPDGRELQEKGR